MIFNSTEKGQDAFNATHEIACQSLFCGHNTKKNILFKTVLPPPEDRSMSKANELVAVVIVLLFPLSYFVLCYSVIVPTFLTILQ